MSLPNKPYIGDQTPNQPFSSPEVPATFDRLFGALVPNIQLDPEPGGSGSAGSTAVTKDIFKPTITDFCLEELQQYKDIQVVGSDARIPDATDEEITLPAAQIGQEYTCLNSAASLWTENPEDEEPVILPIMYGETFDHMYVPILIPSFELVPDRNLDWEQGIEDGRLEVNENFILVYAGSVKDYQNSTAYRINDRILVNFDENDKLYYTGNEEDEVYSFLYAIESFTSNESGDALDQSGLEQPYNSNDYGGRVLLHPWNESTNRASLKLFNLEYWSENWDPNPGDPWQFINETRLIRDASHFVMKEVNGVKTMWHTNWFRAQSFTTEASPYGDRLTLGDDGDNPYALFGSALWKRTGSNTSIVPPFRTSVEDGSSINMVGRISTLYRGYEYREFRCNVLGNQCDNNENVEIPFGVTGNTSNGQSIRFYWLRDNCSWVYENT